MNDPVKKAASYTEIHQCLFGYQDGHRLLASSLRLPEDASTILLLLSDLAPGLSLPPNCGYWTGVPLPSAKSYALIRTWLAPEMSRPGCVWSHVLIIAFSDIARFPDLSILADHVKRPNTTPDFETYNKSILLTPAANNSAPKQNTSNVNAANAHLVVQTIYSDQATGSIFAPLGKLDATIFAVWSQQWPRLRRSFSFRTAASTNDSLSTTKRFDLVVKLASDRNQANQLDKGTDYIEAWEKTCIDDLLFPHSTGLRKFLWRYGSDVTHGLSRFKFLTNIYLSTRSNQLAGNHLHKILMDITGILSSKENGKVLKEDLIGRSQYSLLPSPDPINLLAFYVTEPIADKLPPLPTETFEEIHNGWHGRSEEILSIAEIAAERETELGTKFLHRLAALIDASNFFFSTKTRPNIRNILLRINPSLLDTEELVKVSSADLLKFIEYVPDNDHMLTNRILQRLIFVKDADLAQKMVGRFPDLVIANVITTMEAFFTAGGKIVPQPWLEAVGGQTSSILRGGYIEHARATSTLSFIASMLGYAQPKTLQVGPIPWAKGLTKAHDDVVGSDRQKFLVFLLKLALNNPVPGCEPLLELAFDSIHTALRYSKLDEDQTSQLLEYLPKLAWFKNWDNCLRLRVKIVDTYIKGNLNPTSFKRLTNDPELREDLIKMAENSKHGHEFLEMTNREMISGANEDQD